MFLQLKVFFKKAGGLNLLKQWLKLGILPVTFIEFLILGYDKKSLELLRLIAGLKIQKKLKKKYGKLQSDFKLEKREGDSILQQMILSNGIFLIGSLQYLLQIIIKIMYHFLII